MSAFPLMGADGVRVRAGGNAAGLGGPRAGKE